MAGSAGPLAGGYNQHSPHAAQSLGLFRIVQGEFRVALLRQHLVNHLHETVPAIAIGDRQPLKPVFVELIGETLFPCG